MTEHAEWVALVDESGNFDDPREAVCVGGLLLRAADSAQLAQALRGAVEEALPHLRYPPHASEFNRLSFHVMSWYGLSLNERHRLPAALARPLERAAKALEGVPDAPADLKAAPHNPSVELLAMYDRWLETRVPVAFRSLQAVRDHCYRQLWRVLAHYTSTCKALAIAAVESRSGPRRPPGPDEDRYLRLLAVLCERLVQLARLTEPPPRIVLRVASRRVLRLERASELTREDLVTLAEQVTRTSLPGGTRIELVPEPPERYGTRVHPGLTLADYVVNQLRFILVHGNSLPWARALQAVRSQLALPIELTVGSMQKFPTLAADGAPQQAILSVLSGAPSPDLAAVQPRWVREQAETCMTLLGTDSRSEVVQ